MDVHRAARVMAVAHGGQVLLSGEAARGVGTDVQLLDLGYHRLKDLPEAEHLFQLIGDGLDSQFPRLRSLNRSNLPTPSGELIGRKNEIEQALTLLERGEVRVLTLVVRVAPGRRDWLLRWLRRRSPDTETACDGPARRHSGPEVNGLRDRASAGG